MKNHSNNISLTKGWGHQQPLWRCVMCALKAYKKKVATHKNCETHLKFACEKLNCKICEPVSDPLEKEAHLDIIACNKIVLKSYGYDFNFVEFS